MAEIFFVQIVNVTRACDKMLQILLIMEQQIGAMKATEARFKILKNKNK